MYSPQSQKLRVGSTVRVYVINATAKTAHPIIVFHFLNAICSILSSIRFILQRKYFFAIICCSLIFLIIFYDLFAFKKIRLIFALAISNHGLWCNGNTTVFGTVIQGSSPCRPTKKLLHLKELFLCF